MTPAQVYERVFVAEDPTFANLPQPQQLRQIAGMLCRQDSDRLDALARRNVDADLIAVGCKLFAQMMDRRKAAIPAIPTHLGPHYDPHGEEAFDGAPLHDIGHAVALRIRMIEEAEARYRGSAVDTQGSRLTSSDLADIFGSTQPTTLNRAARHRRERRY